MDENEKPDYYRLAEQFPDQYKLLPTGAVYSMEKKKIVAMDSSRNPWAITRDNTLEMHKRRRTLARDAVLRSLEAGTGSVDAGIEILSDALVEIVKKKGNRAVEAYRALMQAAGLAFDTGVDKGDSDHSVAGVSFTASPQALRLILDAIAEAKSRRDEESGGGDVDEIIDAGS